MNFGPIDRYLLIGGGQLLFNVATRLAGKSHCTYVVTSQRHSLEHINTASGTISLKDGLQATGISFHMSPNVNRDQQVSDFITDQTLGISLASAWIFTPAFIRRFKGRLVNVHGQRLPTDRGGGGFSWVIMNSQRWGGCVIHLVDSGIDSGDVVACREYFYPVWCRKPVDYQKFADQENTPLLEQFIDDIEALADFQLIKQEDHLSTYWPRLHTGTHGFIDWSWDLNDIERFICAFDEPYPGASTFVNERRVFLKDCYSQPEGGSFHPFQAGLVYKRSENGLVVAVRGGSLIVHDVQDERGDPVLHEIRLGDRFHTPQEYLDRAMRFRAIYTAEGLKQPPPSGASR